MKNLWSRRHQHIYIAKGLFFLSPANVKDRETITSSIPNMQ